MSITIIKERPKFILDTFESSTKHAGMLKLADRLPSKTYYTIGGTREKSYIGYVNMNHRRDDKSFIYTYVAEKHRKKVEVVTVKGKRVHKIVKPAHWKFTLYKFPLSSVVTVKQHNRTFTAILNFNQ